MSLPTLTPRRLVTLGILLIGGLVLGACDTDPGSSGPEPEFPVNNCSIQSSRLVDGGVGKDGIPALTNPAIVTPDHEHAQYLADTSRVIGVLVDGRPLAVPHNILWHHEIINFDDLRGRTVAVTYCPLTGSSLAFDREAVNGAEFGVSGLLLDNNLVMYDRQEEESLWPQMSRQAQCGTATGTALDVIPVVEMRWDRWQALHPDTEVVSNQTGYARDYRPQAYPYGDYEGLNTEPLFPAPVDDRRPPKERVLGIPAGPDGGIALPFRALDAAGPARVVTVTAGETQKTVFWSRAAESAMAFETSASFSVQNGKIVDEETESTWSVEGVATDGPREGDRLEPVDEAYVAFWFAWAAFQPDTDLWTN